jgi:predicted GIY-YIG superfamily endonuclease
MKLSDIRFYLQTVVFEDADGNVTVWLQEMSELRTILGEATGRSLVLVDELCRGTEVQKGTFIAASVIESLDRIGCMGILSTHLHDLLDMKLQITNVVQMAMGTKEIDGRLEPTWKLVDGACRQSLAFEVARREGVPENVVQRAEELYKLQSISSTRINIPVSSNTIWVAENEEVLNVQNGCSNIEEFHGQKDCTAMPMLNLRKELQLNGHDSQLQSDGIITAKEYTFGPDKKIKDVMVIYENICRTKLLEINHFSTHTGAMQLHCSLVGPRQLPPPLTTKHSCVYMLQRPDGQFYVGQSDNLVGRIIHHRKNLKSNETSFLYVMVANKSVACELETTLINQLPSWGITVVNKGDQNHRHFATAPHIEPPPF